MSPIDSPIRLQCSTFVRGPAVCHVSARAVSAGQTPPLHSHDFPELFWIESGRAAHILPNAPLPLVEGSLVLVAPTDVHGFATANAKGYSIFNLAFSQEYWNAFWQRYKPVMGNSAEPSDPFSLPLQARSYQLDKAALAALKQASAELRSGQRTGKALDRFLLNAFYVLQAVAPLATGFSTPGWLRNAIATCGASPDQLALGVAALVEHTGKSPEHLSRQCRKWLGKTPTDLVNEMRLDCTANQLVTTNQSIVGLAQAVGFLNISHFYRLFQRRFGVTPAEHRAAALRVLRP